LQISNEAIRTPRDRTGAGIMDCKRALEQSGGDVAKAEAALRAKGIASAAKKADRNTSEGIIDAYIHAGSRIGAIVELNCETDFVARTPEFKELAHNLAMQVAAMAPVYVDETQIPAEETRKPEEIALLKQSFIRDPSKTINDLVMDARARVGENIRVRRFTRFSLGE
jgi:elongation factor Ts